MTIKRRVITLTVTTACAAYGYSVLGGDLNPPAGPVVPTHKTLSEVEPRIAINANNTPGDADSLFKITQPGSYYLTGNVSGVSGKKGIELVSVNNVTIDLRGFTMQGVSGANAGVWLESNCTNVVVRNGTITGWFNGIAAGGGATVSSSHTRFEKLTVTGNSGMGIAMGQYCQVFDCLVNSNMGGGITAGLGTQPVLYCLVSRCIASGNSGVGIGLPDGSSALDCIVAWNTSGLSAGNGCTVGRCTATNNTGDGMLVASRCLVVDNTCSSNGYTSGDGAGIHVIGADNRIEANNCTGADRGVDVDAAGNFITRNTCSGNTVNWDIAASNKCLVVLGVNAAAINGDSGGTAPGSTDPNANFTF